MNLVPFVVTNPEAASVLAEPAMTPSVLAEVGVLTPSVLASSGFTDSVAPAGAGAGADGVRPVRVHHSSMTCQAGGGLGVAYSNIWHLHSACLVTSYLPETVTSHFVVLL